MVRLLISATCPSVFPMPLPPQRKCLWLWLNCFCSWDSGDILYWYDYHWDDEDKEHPWQFLPRPLAYTCWALKSRQPVCCPFQLVVLFLGVLGHGMLSCPFKSMEVLHDFSNSHTIEVTAGLFELFLSSLRHGVVERLLALSVGQRSFRTWHPGWASVQAVVRIPERLDGHLVRIMRSSQLTQQLMLLFLSCTGGDELPESDVEISDHISCWRIVHKDLIPSVLEFFFKRMRECLEQGGTLMVRIAHGIENLVAKMQAVWQHVLNMCGIITFKGVNVHLI
jgi:hypothetical protein